MVKVAGWHFVILGFVGVESEAKFDDQKWLVF
jgi:hypothetical protein